MYIHVGINVTNLEESISFYTKLFGVEPVKVKENYAKFLLDNPNTNFTLNVRDEVSGNQLNHFGFQLTNTEEVLSQKNRLEELGWLTKEEMDVTCCYARQDKFWVQDPDGNGWEFFYTKEDAKVYTKVSDSACCYVAKIKSYHRRSSSPTRSNPCPTWLQSPFAQLPFIIREK
jgi:catechol 2,3-dioxygenase-like lactoylglutathione lyase family enzyme